MKIFDTHAHLDQLGDLQGAMKRAAQEGVEGIVALSMDLQSCRRNLEIREQYAQPKIYIGLGMHPSETRPADAQLIIELIKKHSSGIHAVREIGLDFWYKWVSKDNEKKDEQCAVYRKFLECARDIDKPAVIHSRGAWRESFEIAAELGVKKAEFHWYSGPVDVLREILDAGYYVSTSPSVAYSPQSREAMSFAPIERTLIETDCPVYYRNKETGEGFQAEPKDVFKTLDAYCALKGVQREPALEILNRNAREFFNLN